MKIGVTRNELISLLKGKRRLKIENDKWARLYGVINNETFYLTTLKITKNGTLKIIENPVKLKWFEHEKYLIITSKTIRVFAR